MVSFIEVLTTLSIAFTLSTLGMRQSRFYYALMQKFVGNYALPATSPLVQQKPGTGTVFHQVIHQTSTPLAIQSAETRKEIARAFDPDFDENNQTKAIDADLRIQ